MDNLVMGVDIGGSHITAALVNITKGALLEGSMVRDSVSPEGSVDEIMGSWIAVINNTLALLKQQNNINIGIAMPGPFDYEKGICLIKDQKKYRSLYGINVKNMLAEKLNVSNSQVNFFNDACSFLNGEIMGGAVKNKKSAIGITLGTGLGSAVYEHGLCTDAALWDFPFKDGIVEDYISTRWFTTEFYNCYGINVSGVKEMVNLIKEDKSKEKIFEDFGKNLAKFLKDISVKAQCNTIVLGGNIAKASGYFLDTVLDMLQKETVNLEIRVTEIGESASIIGAAGAAQKRLLQQLTDDKKIEPV